MNARYSREFASFAASPATLIQCDSPTRYTRQQLYDIVSDVPSYPRFVPYCTAARILKSHTTPHSPDASSLGPHTMDAELTVGFSSFTESYVSRVTCKPREFVEVRHYTTDILV